MVVDTKKEKASGLPNNETRLPPAVHRVLSSAIGECIGVEHQLLASTLDDRPNGKSKGNNGGVVELLISLRVEKVSEAIDHRHTLQSLLLCFSLPPS